MHIRLSVMAFFLLGSMTYAAPPLQPANTKAGYLAQLLVNEVPFPGEKGWISEVDTKSAMHAILGVLNSRLNHVPPGYAQKELAAVQTRDIIDVMTAGGVRGQCDGFYRDKKGTFTTVPRVAKRIAYLSKIATTGKPGKFARLLYYAQGLANAYFKAGMVGADRYAGLRSVGGVRVTGRAYSWMTDRDYYHPGGDFVKIPDGDQGSLGGNRFSTLKKRK